MRACAHPDTEVLDVNRFINWFGILAQVKGLVLMGPTVFMTEKFSTMAFSIQYCNHKIFLTQNCPMFYSCVHLRRISVGSFWYKGHISPPLMEVQHFEHRNAWQNGIWHNRHIVIIGIHLVLYTYMSIFFLHMYIHVHRYGARLPVSLSAPCMVTGEESRVCSTEETMSSVDRLTTPSG